MNKIVIAIIASMFAVASFAATSTPKGFTDNLDEALKRAKENKRYVVAVFSGSDWCGWCKKLEKEILSTDTFRKGAEGKYELVYIDNPRNKDLLSEHGKKNNEKLTDKYEIRGFPSVLVLDADGKKVAELGYEKAGPAKFLEKLETAIKQAPDIAKYITPIEEKLNACDKVMEKAVEEAMKEVMKAVLKKHGKMLETTLEEARKMEVPDYLKERKEKMILMREMGLKQIKDAIEDEDETPGSSK